MRYMRTLISVAVMKETGFGAHRVHIIRFAHHAVRPLGSDDAYSKRSGSPAKRYM